MIHSIDDAALVRKIDAAAAAAGRSLELLVQVDLAGEATKHGAREADLPAMDTLAPQWPGEAVPVVLVTHETQESAMREAVIRIAALGAVLEAPTMIRIEAA